MHKKAEKAVMEPILMITSGDVKTRPQRNISIGKGQLKQSVQKPRYGNKLINNARTMTTYGNKRITMIDPRQQLSTVKKSRPKPHNLDNLNENSIEMNMMHAKQRTNIASADYTMNSRLSHLIVDDFSDYAALLGMNSPVLDSAPQTNNVAYERFQKIQEDSVMSQAKESRMRFPEDKN